MSIRRFTLTALVCCLVAVSFAEPVTFEPAEYEALNGLAQFEVERLLADPDAIASLAPLVIPPGSPIGAFSKQDALQ